MPEQLCTSCRQKRQYCCVVSTSRVLPAMYSVAAAGSSDSSYCDNNASTIFPAYTFYVHIPFVGSSVQVATVAETGSPFRTR